MTEIDKARELALRVLEEHLGLFESEIAALSDKTPLLSIGAMDSLDVVELVLTFEEELEIEIPDVLVEKLVTFGDLVAAIRENIDGSV